MAILDDTQSVDGTGYQATNENLINAEALEKAMSDNFDMKGLTKTIVAGTESVLSNAANNISFITNANMVRGGSPYQSINTSGSEYMDQLIGEGENISMNAYIQGASVYLDSLNDIYSSVGSFVNMGLEAEYFDRSQEIAWANQALEEEQYDIDVATFEETKRHAGVMRKKEEEARAKAKAEKDAAEKSEQDRLNFYSSLLNGGSGGTTGTTDGSSDDFFDFIFHKDGLPQPGDSDFIGPVIPDNSGDDEWLVGPDTPDSTQSGWLSSLFGNTSVIAGIK